MVCREEFINSISYDYCPDELPPVADRVQSVLRARFIDELTGHAIKAQLTVSSQLNNVVARASSTAVAGLTGNPARLFPMLDVNTVNLNMRVACRRFISQTFHADLGPFNILVGDPADYPEFFTPVDLGDIALHRAASFITGRCVQDNGISRTPLSNVAVDISGLWHQFPAAHVDPITVLEVPRIISLLHGLYADRQAGVDQIRQRNLLPQIGEEKTLLLPASADSRQIRLSNRVNLAVGSVLGIDIAHNDLVEYLQVLSIDGASTATQPATITLAYPLSKFHREGTSVVRVIPQAAGTTNNLLRDAVANDQTLFLDALTDISDSTVEISGSGTTEYHPVRLYSVLSDADGYFSLPPISRVAMMQLHASHAGPVADVDLIFSPDYEQFENRIDLIFS